MFPSYYFTREEFCCPCCDFNAIDAELLRVLNDLRFSFSAPVIINSGCRCVRHNEEIQKKVNSDYIPYSSCSQHLLGKAADIVVKGVSLESVYDHLIHKYVSMYGIAKYPNFIHFDVRSTKARW